jgi:hypothetical protein
VVADDDLRYAIHGGVPGLLRAPLGSGVEGRAPAARQYHLTGISRMGYVCRPC